ncbi:MAG: hypothetical protein ACRCX2_23185 [Paraclostridium sp.]
MENINIISIDNENLYESLSEKLKERLLSFQGENMMVCSRVKNSSFLNIFKDSLYTYNDGSVLIERFYFKDKCKKYPFSHKKFKQEDQDIIKEFEDFSNNIPDINDLSDEEIELTTEKVNKYQEAIGRMIPEIATTEITTYDDNLLLDFDEFNEDMIDRMAKSGVRLFLELTNTLTWNNLEDTGLVVMGVPYTDYVDILLTYLYFDNKNIEVLEDDKK